MKHDLKKPRLTSHCTFHPYPSSSLSLQIPFSLISTYFFFLFLPPSLFILIWLGWWWSCWWSMILFWREGINVYLWENCFQLYDHILDLFQGEREKKERERRGKKKDKGESMRKSMREKERRKVPDQERKKKMTGWISFSLSSLLSLLHFSKDHFLGRVLHLFFSLSLSFTLFLSFFRR